MTKDEIRAKAMVYASNGNICALDLMREYGYSEDDAVAIVKHAAYLRSTNGGKELFFASVLNE